MPKAVFLGPSYITYSIPSHFSVGPDDVRREDELAVPVATAQADCPKCALSALRDVQNYPNSAGFMLKRYPTARSVRMYRGWSGSGSSFRLSCLITKRRYSTSLPASRCHTDCVRL